MTLEAELEAVKAELKKEKDLLEKVKVKHHESRNDELFLRKISAHQSAIDQLEAKQQSLFRQKRATDHEESTVSRLCHIVQDRVSHCLPNSNRMKYSCTAAEMTRTTSGEEL